MLTARGSVSAMSSIATVRPHKEATRNAAQAPARRRRVPTSPLEHRVVRPVFKMLFQGVALGLRATGLHARGRRNAVDIRLNRIEMMLPGLPRSFDGYTILHMSDLHADGPLELDGAIGRALDGVEVDLCALTGDYRYRLQGTHHDAARPMAEILRHVRARDGVVGVLGNHDLGTMVAPLREIGIDVLVNDHRALRRGDDEIVLIGLDDVHAYQPSHEAADALNAMPEGFRILLLHSPELLDEAAAAGVSLYLAGHTHGGQICLPGGRPVLTNIRSPRRYVRGEWRHGDMQGYTTSGVGVSVLPLRYHCPPEVALITLRQG